MALDPLWAGVSAAQGKKQRGVPLAMSVLAAFASITASRVTYCDARKGR